MSLYDIMMTSSPMTRRSRNRMAFVNDIYEQIVSTPGVYDEMYSSISEEMGKGSSGGKAFSWSVFMNKELFGMSDNDIKNDPVRATTLGSIYKMAEIAADAYQVYSGQGLDREAAGAAAQSVLFGQGLPSGQSIYEGLTTVGTVGQTLAYLSRVDSEGELNTHYLLPTDGGFAERVFKGILDYNSEGNELDVGSSAGAFLQTTFDKTLIGNALIKMYDYFKGNSPTFFTNYRAAAMYENVQMGGEDALLGKTGKTVATLFGYGGSIAENITVGMAAGKFGMATLGTLGLNVMKSRLMDYEHSTGMEERFNTRKFMNSMLYDTIAIGTSLWATQVGASAIMSHTSVGRDGWKAISRFLVTKDASNIPKIAGAAASQMFLDIGLDMGIDYTFHHIGQAAFGKDIFTPYQVNRFDIDIANDPKGAARKIMNEFMFRSAMRVGGAIARGAMVKKVAGEAPILSEKWFRNNMLESDLKDPKSMFAMKTAVLMWNIYPSNLKAVDQIMKSNFSQSLTERLKLEQAGDMRGFGPMYNLMWHQAELSSNIIYRWMMNLTGNVIAGPNFDKFYRFSINGGAAIKALLFGTDVGEKKISITTEEQARAVARIVRENIQEAFQKQGYTQALVDTESLGDPSQFKNSAQYKLLARILRQYGSLFELIDIGPNDDMTTSAIKQIIQTGIKDGISNVVNGSGDVLRTSSVPSFTMQGNTIQERAAIFSKDLSELMVFRLTDSGEASGSGKAGDHSVTGNYRSVEELSGDKELFFIPLAEKLFAANDLKDSWNFSLDQLTKASEAMGKVMDFVGEQSKWLYDMGEVDLREDGVYTPRTVNIDGAEQVRQPMMSSWKAFLEDGLTGSMKDKASLMTTLSKVAKDLKDSADSTRGTDSQRKARYFTSLAEYLDLMGASSAWVMIGDLESAIRVVSDTGAGAEEKALAVTKAKRTITHLGATFFRYAGSEEKLKIMDLRNRLNDVSKRINFSAIKFQKMGYEDLFIDPPEVQLMSYYKSMINPFVTMDEASARSLGIEDWYNAMKGNGGDDIEVYKRAYELVNGTTMGMVETKELDKFIRVLDSSGKPIKWKMDTLLSPYDLIGRAFTGSPDVDEADGVIGFYVLKKMHIELLNEKLELIRNGNPEEAASRTIENSKRVAAAKDKMLNDFGINVSLDETGIIVVRPKEGTSGFGRVNEENVVTTAAKEEVFNYLTSAWVPAKEVVETAGLYRHALRGVPNVDATRQITIMNNGKHEVHNIDSIINLIKKNTPGAEEYVQAHFSELMHNPSAAAFSDSEVSGIMRTLFASMPGFTIVSRATDAASESKDLMDISRIIVNRLLLESDTGRSLEVSKMRGEIQSRFGLGAGIERLDNVGVNSSVEVYRVSIKEDMTEQWESIKTHIENQHGLVYVMNSDSTQNTYYFTKTPKDAGEVVDMFDSFITRTIANVRMSSSEMLVWEPVLPVRILTKGELNSAVKSGSIDTHVENVKGLVKLTSHIFGITLSDETLDTIDADVAAIKRQYDTIVNRQTGGSADDRIKSVAKYFSLVQKYENKIARLMTGSTSDDPIPIRSIPETDLVRHNFEIGTSVKTLEEDLASDDPFIAVARGNAMHLSTLGSDNLKNYNDIIAEARKISKPTEREMYVAAKQSQVSAIKVQLALELVKVSDAMSRPLVEAAKRFNSSAAEPGELERIIDDYESKYPSLTMSDPNASSFEKDIANAWSNLKKVMQDNYAAGMESIGYNYGDLFAGAFKSWDYDTKNPEEIRQYFYSNILTDGFASRFEVGEAAKRMSAGSTINFTSRAVIQEEVDSIEQALGIMPSVAIHRLPPPGDKWGDGMIIMSSSYAAALEKYGNINGLSFKVLESLMKVQVVDDASTNHALEIYTGDLKSQSAAMIAFLAPEIMLAPDKKTIEIYSRSFVVDFLSGATIQSKPTFGIGEGLQSTQFNGMTPAAILSANRMNYNMLSSRSQARYNSSMEYQNAIAAAFRRGMYGKQGSYQIYNSRTLQNSNFLIDQVLFDKFFRTTPNVSKGGEALQSADYQMELPAVVLAKWVIDAVGKSPLEATGRDRQMLEAANNILEVRAKRLTQSPDELNQNYLAMLEFLSSKATKDDVSFVVKESYTDDQGKKHSVYLANPVRYSNDGLAHTMPFVITNIRDPHFGERIGLNIRGAAAQGGDFDKDSIVIYAFNNKALGHYLDTVLDRQLGSTKPNDRVATLFELHSESGRFERSRPAKSFYGIDDRGKTDPASAGMFGMTISSYFRHMNALAILRRQGVDGARTIKFDKARTTEAGYKATSADPIGEREALYNPVPLASQMDTYKLMFGDTNLILVKPTTGNNEYEKIYNGDFIGGINTSKTDYGMINKNVSYHKVYINGGETTLVSVRGKAGFGDVVGLYTTTSSGTIRQLLSGISENATAKEIADKLGSLSRIDLGNNLKVGWHSDMYRSGSASFVDYVKSHGGEKAMKSWYGAKNAQELLVNFERLNNKMIAASATELVAFQAYRSLNLVAAPIELSRDISKRAIGTLDSALAAMTTASGATTTDIVTPITQALAIKGEVVDAMVRIDHGDSSIISQVEKMLWDNVSVVKGGIALAENKLASVGENSEGVEKSIKDFIDFVNENGGSSSVEVLPPVLRGVVDVIRSESAEGYRMNTILPKYIRSKVSDINQIDELFGNSFIRTKEQQALADNIFAAYNLMESIRTVMPAMLGRGDIREASNSAVNDPILLKSIDSIEQLAATLKTAMSASTTKGGSSYSEGAIRNFLDGLGVKVVPGKEYLEESPESFAARSGGGVLNTYINNARGERNRMVRGASIGRYNYLAIGDKNKPLTSAALYGMFVKHATKENTIEANVFSRAVYTAFLSSSVASKSASELMLIGLAGGKDNLNAVVNSLSADRNNQGFMYKFDLDKLKDAKLGGAKGQADLRMLDMIMLKNANVIEETNNLKGSCL